MKIIEAGSLIRFKCSACGCLFEEGVHIVTPHPEWQYACDCPCCGNKCVSEIGVLVTERENSSYVFSSENIGSCKHSEFESFEKASTVTCKTPDFSTPTKE